MPRIKSYPYRMPMFPQKRRATTALFRQNKFVRPNRTSFSNSVPEGMASGSSSTVVYQRPKKRVIRTSFKSKLVNAQPAKHYSYTADQATTASVIYTTCPTSGITQGTTNAQRDGDSVYLAALKGRYTYASEVGIVGNFIGRIIIGWSGEEYTGVGTDFGAGLATGELFLPGTTTFPLNGIINPKAFTCIYDETMDVDNFSAGSASMNQNTGTFNIPLDTNFVYQASGSTMGKTRNLYVVFIAGQVGAPALTATGIISIALDLIFK